MQHIADRVAKGELAREDIEETTIQKRTVYDRAARTGSFDSHKRRTKAFQLYAMAAGIHGICSLRTNIGRILPMRCIGRVSRSICLRDRRFGAVGGR